MTHYKVSVTIWERAVAVHGNILLRFPARENLANKHLDLQIGKTLKCSMSCILPLGWCLTCSVTVIRYSNKSNLRHQGFIWLTVTVHHHEKVKAAGTVAMNSHVSFHLALLFFCLVQSPRQEMVSLTLRMGLIAPVNQGEEISHRHAHRPTYFSRQFLTKTPSQVVLHCVCQDQS